MLDWMEGKRFSLVSLLGSRQRKDDSCELKSHSHVSCQKANEDGRDAKIFQTFPKSPFRDAVGASFEYQVTARRDHSSAPMTSATDGSFNFRRSLARSRAIQSH